jgi:chromosome segregation ATPase
MDKFEKWFNKVNEELTESPAINTEVADVTVADVDADRSNMIGDIDNIMTSLETLASELTEELAIELEDLNEAGVVDKAGDFIKSWITGMKATKAQGKVNKIKMNYADLKFAADTAKGDKSTNLDKKATAVKDQAKDLQTLVDQKFAASGAYVASKLAAAKIAGQIEIIKRTTGMEDDPKKKTALKDKMAELAGKYKEEVAATKELDDENKEEIKAKKKELKGDTPGDEETEAPTDKRTDAEKQADAAAAEEETEEPAETEEPTETEEPEETEEPTETDADKIAKIEAAIKTINNNTEEAKKSIVTKTKELEQAKRDVENGKGSSDTVQKIENRIEEEREDIKDLKADELAAKKELKKMSAQESLIYRATEASLLELATEISEKADWQLDNTVLYTKYDTIIKKAGYDSIITEASSIKDKFNTLLNS